MLEEDLIVGGEYIVINNKGCSFNIGDIVTFNRKHMSKSNLYWFGNKDIGLQVLYLSQVQPKLVFKKEQRQMYEFNVSAAEQIDFSEIYKETSRQKPLFMVEYKGDNGSKSYHVVIHGSLWDKAEYLGLENPQRDIWIDHNRSVKLNHPSEFSDWKKWAKEVIETPWKGEKGKVIVKELEL